MKKFLAFLLSIIMVLSVCATPISVVFAAEETDQSPTIEEILDSIDEDELVQVADQVINASNNGDNRDLLFRNMVKYTKRNKSKKEKKETDASWKDYFDKDEIVELICDYFFGDEPEEKPDPTDKVIGKLDDLSQKMGQYAKELSDTLTKISLQIGKEKFSDKINSLNTYNRYSGVSSLNILVQDEQKYIDQKNTEQLKKLYSSMAEQTVGLKEHTTNLQLFGDICGLIYGAHDTPAFSLALDLFIAKYPNDAEKAKKEYRTYIDNTTKEVSLAYVSLISGCKARHRYYTNFDIDETRKKLSFDWFNTINNDMLKVMIYYLKAVEESENLTKAGVILDSGKEQTYSTPGRAWQEMTAALNNKTSPVNSVEFILYDDWIANAKQGFAGVDTLSGTPDQTGFTAKKEIFVSSKAEVTINLNGHSITAAKEVQDGVITKSLNMNIIELEKNAKVTITGLSKDKLKKDQKQGLYGGTSGIVYTQDDGNGATITLKNFTIDTFSGHGIYIIGNANVKLKAENMVLQNCHDGALIFEQYADFEIKNSEFNDNQSGLGGAIGIWNYSDNPKHAVLTKCSFNNNSANSGGAIAMACTVEQCQFNGNTATNTGGAIYGGAKITNSTFTNNTCKSGSGGALHWPESVYNCVFENNTASGDGGAIRILHDKKITGCKFINNKSTKGEGGAIYVPDFTNLEVDGCTFDKNSAAKEGGAISIGKEKDLTVKNSNFTNNSSQSKGGAIYTHYRVKCVAENCTFTGNYAKYDGGALNLGELIAYYHSLKNVTIKNNNAGRNGGGLYLRKYGTKTGDCDVCGKVIITDNTANNKQGNVFLEQKGAGNTVLDAKNLDHGSSKIGLGSDLKDNEKAVKNASNESTYFGDNKRGIEKKGSQINLKKLPGGCGK